MKIPTVWNASESTRRVKRRALSSSRQVRNRCGAAHLASGGANAEHLRRHRTGEVDLADDRPPGPRKGSGGPTVLARARAPVAAGQAGGGFEAAGPRHFKVESARGEA